MKHIQEAYDGTSIEEWDKSHGIRMVIIGDCEYATCPAFEAFRVKCDEDEVAYFKAQVAEQQAEAYGIK